MHSSEARSGKVLWWELRPLSGGPTGDSAHDLVISLDVISQAKRGVVPAAWHKEAEQTDSTQVQSFADSRPRTCLTFEMSSNFPLPDVGNVASAWYNGCQCIREVQRPSENLLSADAESP